MNIEHHQQLQTVIERLDAPFFFYDLDKLKRHLEKINEVLHPDVKLWYACKANPMSAILKVLRNLGFGIDVASKGELFQVLNAGIKPEFILATGPGKSKEYLRHLLNSGVNTIVLESLNQAIWLEEVAKEENTKINALLRVQLDWQEGKSVLGGDAITPFGISKDDWQPLDPTNFEYVQFKGFHVFQWGNILDLSQLETIWDRSLAEVKELSESLKIPCEIMDLGGGLGIPYDLTSDGLEFKDVHDILIKLKDKYQLKHIWMELGRYTVGECGYYFTKILDRKKVRGQNILVTDGGMNHIARKALTDQPFPCSLFRKSTAMNTSFQVHGPLCTAMDHLGTFDIPSDVEVGDWLAFHKAGAYGFTESMPYFLCHQLAGEVIIYNGDVMIPRPPRESFEWMI
jgi:diaminopimelate decarboxylase